MQTDPFSKKRKRLIFLSIFVAVVVACGFFVFVQEQRNSVRTEEINQSLLLESSLEQAAVLLIDPNLQNDTIIQGLVVDLLSNHASSSIQSLAALDPGQSRLMGEVDQTLQSVADPWTLSCLSFSQKVTLASTLISLGKSFALGYSRGSDSSNNSISVVFLLDFGPTSLSTNLVQQIVSDTNTIGQIDCPNNGLFP